MIYELDPTDLISINTFKGFHAHIFSVSNCQHLVDLYRHETFYAPHPVCVTTTPRLGLNKIFVYFKAFMHERIILVLPLPICFAHTIAILLHDDCATYDPPPNPPFERHTPYTIGIGNIL